jgi:hypothetical protein
VGRQGDSVELGLNHITDLIVSAFSPETHPIVPKPPHNIMSKISPIKSLALRPSQGSSGSSDSGKRVDRRKRLGCRKTGRDPTEIRGDCWVDVDLGQDEGLRIRES